MLKKKKKALIHKSARVRVDLIRLGCSSPNWIRLDLFFNGLIYTISNSFQSRMSQSFFRVSYPNLVASNQPLDGPRRQIGRREVINATGLIEGQQALHTSWLFFFKFENWPTHSRFLSLCFDPTISLSFNFWPLL